MKSQIVEVGSKKVLDFPKLMQGKMSGVIVLFNQVKVGQVVCGECCGHKIGDYANEWCMSKFKDFNGTIKLSNE
jgi:hypothetical protein